MVLSLLLLRAPVIDQPGSHIVVDGAEANNIIEQSNTKMWGMVKTVGDTHGVILLGVVRATQKTQQSTTTGLLHNRRDSKKQ